MRERVCGLGDVRIGKSLFVVWEEFLRGRLWEGKGTGDRRQEVGKKKIGLRLCRNPPEKARHPCNLCLLAVRCDSGNAPPLRKKKFGGRLPPFHSQQATCWKEPKVVRSVETATRTNAALVGRDGR